MSMEKRRFARVRPSGLVPKRGTLVVDGANFAYRGVISAGGSEIQYIYLNMSGGKATNAFASCTGRL